MKKSSIQIQIGLDAQSIPETIQWEATDSPEEGLQKADAMILSLWDSESQNAMRIDLWTKDMRVDDMNFFVFQTIMTLSDTFESATQNAELAKKMRGFGEYFAEQTEVFKDRNS